MLMIKMSYIINFEISVLLLTLYHLVLVDESYINLRTIIEIIIVFSLSIFNTTKTPPPLINFNITY